MTGRHEAGQTSRTSAGGVRFGRAAKAITAGVAALATWCGTALADGQVTPQEWGGLAGVALAAYAVYQKANSA